MLKDTGYQEKIVMLKGWLPEIIEVVKKDLRNEHLKVDKAFCRRYFLGKNPAQMTGEELAPAYEKEILEGNVGLGEFIATRWLLKNTDVYGFFEKRLQSITADFETLTELPQDLSKQTMEESVKEFGAKKTYLFAVLNSVVFPKDVYERLTSLAVSETRDHNEKMEKEETHQTLEMLQKRYARELSMAKERFDKKVYGLEKKYIHDTEKLKKQIATLQRKLSETQR